jgi:hypothetical protein
VTEKGSDRKGDRPEVKVNMEPFGQINAYGGKLT